MTSVWEAVVTLVLKYCGKELEEYGNCVAQYPENWQNKCKDLGEAASACSSNHPAVQKIQHDCAREYQVYDQCLKENPQDVTKCVKPLHQFMDCAEKTASRIQNAYVEKS
ncbi:coiled-coil-helix-coiled-coil-helix domain-containing protein 5-like isoform X2 [Lytechinus pictus]|uniref:coiled-coil-helix-coiled-coil-helix domain-containing protein 5-like isoform X2 n=1 Tax=Lytechinus pictus TaxID=7653 RepID=UPI0030BA1B43